MSSCIVRVPVTEFGCGLSRVSYDSDELSALFNYFQSNE